MAVPDTLLIEGYCRLGYTHHTVDSEALEFTNPEGLMVIHGLLPGHVVEMQLAVRDAIEQLELPGYVPKGWVEDSWIETMADVLVEAGMKAPNFPPYQPE